MPIFPLTERYRNNIADQLIQQIGTEGPLTFLQKKVFAQYPRPGDIVKRILPRDSDKLGLYYYKLVRNVELSAWSARPPLLVALLRAFPSAEYQQTISKILHEGPFMCHPQDNPYWVCRVETELPLIGRKYTRGTAAAFDVSAASHNREGKRVLRVYGPPSSGKTHTLKFFTYLENIQPSIVGVIDIDFGDAEMAPQAANASIPLELFLAQRMEEQVRRRRAELQATNDAGGDFPDLDAILDATPAPHIFQPFTHLQQRNRWAKGLANELVDQVIYRLIPEPTWWVIVFDNCEKAPVEAQEFVRRLVERAAGIATDPASVKEADAVQIRVVLLGDSKDLLPASCYMNHVQDDDLNAQNLGQNELIGYFITFRECRSIELDANRIQTLAAESIARAQEIMTKPGAPPPPWPQALATAVTEKTLSLEELASQKRSEGDGS